MTEAEYAKLTRQQKLAVFLIVIGPESAAEVLRNFDDADIELLCREMSTFTFIPAEIQKLAFEEFSGLIAKSMGSALGGMGYAQRTLAIAKGDYKASAIMGRVGPVGTSVEVIKDIAEMAARSSTWSSTSSRRRSRSSFPTSTARSPPRCFPCSAPTCARK
jgi:flagellar motor switch protein FliG